MPYETLEKLQHIRNEQLKDDNDDYEDPNKVVEEDEDLDVDAPLSGSKKNELSTRANEILEEESKREEIIKTLKPKIASGIKNNQIHQWSMSISFFGSPPDVNLPSKDIQVIEDAYEMYPSFVDVLFCGLDY